LAAVFGGTLFTLYPLCVAHTNDHVAPGDLVRASGGLIVTYGIGAAIGPGDRATRPVPAGSAHDARRQRA
jgi:hypothetical protein